MVKSMIINTLLTIVMASFTACSKDDFMLKNVMGSILLSSTDYVKPVFDPSLHGDYFVSPFGNDEDSGTFDNPWATWGKAFATADAGDTVYIMGGVYMATPNPNINRSGIASIKPKQGIGHTGTRENPICFFAYPPDFEKGNFPILDGSKLYPNTNYNIAIDLEYTEFIHIIGLTVRNFYQYDGGRLAMGFSTLGANFTFENCTVYNLSGRAFTSFSAAWNTWDGTLATNEWGGNFTSDTTRWINCDAYNLCDTLSNAGSGNAADGWKCHTYQNNYFYWEGCRAWNYSDDGIDPSGAGYKILKNCWVMSTDKYSSVAGVEGNGFKLASPNSLYYFPEEGDDTILTKYINCIAADCVGHGFYNNILLGSVNFPNNAYIYNNFAYHNYTGFGDTGKDSICTSTIRNNIAYDATDIGFEVYLFGMKEFEGLSNNTWRWRNGWPWWEDNPDYTVTDADFVSLDMTQLTLPRKSDGSLPDITFGHLAEGSDLIDAGVDVGLPFLGKAPDIGAFERE